MKKFSIGLIFGLILSFTVTAFAMQQIPFTLLVDGVMIDQPLYSGNNTTYVPLWEIVDAFGAEAKLNGERIDITSPQTDLEKVASECKDSCVMIYGYEDVYAGRIKNQGSGWIYNGYVVTASHVVSRANIIDVYGDDGEYSSATIVYDDKDLDVAVLKVDMALPSVTLGDTAKDGEEVISISCPGGYLNMIDECIYCGIQETVDSTDITLSETFVKGGSSGGAVFNKDSEIIGMLYFDSGGISCAIPINDIKPIFEKLK